MGAIILIIGVIAFGIIWFSISESNKKAERERDAAERAARLEKRRQGLISKHGEDIGMKLFNQQFFIGMTKDQLVDSKGYSPDKTEIEQLKTKTKETWVYGNKNSGDIFVFENEVLTKFKDR